MIRTYSELSRLPTFKERYEYLRIGGVIGESTFGFDRYLNQALYCSGRWRSLRNSIIIRDNGNDMGLDGHDVSDYARFPIIHHMNPITEEDILNENEDIYNPEYLISVSPQTHRAIHFGDFSLLPKPLTERRPDDTMLWTRIGGR